MTASTFNDAYLNFKPHILMILSQIGYTFLYIITEASFNNGMDPFVYVTYRHLVGGLVLLPFAYFIEKKTRPKLTFSLFMEFFILALVGVSITLNMFFKGMEYTSPTFLACIVNTVASLTFIIAITLRLEIVNVRSLRGMAKILGVAVSLGGVMTITLYKGPALENMGHALVHMKESTAANVEGNWLKGSILTIVSCITWSMWYIMQAYSLKRYPAQLSLAVWMNLVGAAQSAVFAVIVRPEKSAWIIGFDIDLWSILYSGIVVSGFVTFVQLYCTEKKGPVFVTIFNPLSTVLVAVLSYFALGEKLYVGSIVGGVIVVIGLYLLLWGKEKDGDAEIELKETKDPKALLFTAADHENQLGVNPI